MPEQVTDNISAATEGRARVVTFNRPEKKNAFRQPMYGRLAETMTREGEVFGRLLSSPEAADAVTAFLEKRPPDYSKFE